MANTAYARQQVGQYLKHFRLNSFNPILRTQTELGNELGLTQKQVSLIECGLTEPPIHLSARWCQVTEWYEGCDLLSHIYGLDPFGFVPVDPALNQDVSKALHNLRRQLKQALNAVEELIDEEPEVTLAMRQGTYQLDTVMKNNKKQVADVIPAIKTYFYALERENRAEIRDIGAMWNNEALSEQVAMPKIDQLDAVAAR